MDDTFNTAKAICEEYSEEVECEPYTKSISVKVKRKYFSELYNRVQNLFYHCQSIAISGGENSIVDAMFLHIDLNELDSMFGDEENDWWKNE